MCVCVCVYLTVLAHHLVLVVWCGWFLSNADRSSDALTLHCIFLLVVYVTNSCEERGRGKEGGRGGGRVGRREGGKEGGREEGRREGGREGEMETGREGDRERGREGEREREGGREGGREGEIRGEDGRVDMECVLKVQKRTKRDGMISTSLL